MLTFSNYSENTVIVRFPDGHNKLNIVNAESLKKDINAIIEKGFQYLIVDFGAITFIDSSGFGAMVTIFNHARNQRVRLVFCNFSKETQALLKITKLDQVFEIYPDVDSAIETIG